jgi:phosphatidylglycerophosphate synthase
MFDPVLRRLIDPPLNRGGAWLAGQGVSANAASLVGLAVGLLSVPLLAFGLFGFALLAILLNRLIDGLDGPIARQGKPTPFGGYLDIVCDMAFYAAVPVGFALASQTNAVWAAVLLAAFVCTGASFLGRAVMAAQRGETDDGRRGRKSFFYAAGLIEGTETWRSCCSVSFRRPFPGWLACSQACACGRRWRVLPKPARSRQPVLDDSRCRHEEFQYIQYIVPYSSYFCLISIDRRIGVKYAPQRHAIQSKLANRRLRLGFWR